MKTPTYPRYTLHGSPADFYVFRDNGPGVPCFWSRWVKGRSDLFYKLKNAKKEAFASIAEELTGYYHSG